VAFARSALLEFLRAELAPTPGRGWATLRIVVACEVATVIGIGFHVPEIHWAIITIFTVSQPDAGASLVKGIQRVIGTLLGGLAGILIVAFFADQPWIRLPLSGCFAAFGLFLSRTTTAPYVGFLGAITALMITAAARGADPEAAIDLGIWRVVLITGGVLVGTGAQLLLWPSDPEETLLDLLGARVAAAGRMARHLLDAAPAQDDETRALERDGFLRQLDLLASAEARYPSLRRRHLEQIALIGASEQVLTAALALARVRPPVGALGEPARQRLEGIAAECGRLGDAFAQRRTPAPPLIADRPSDVTVASAGGSSLLPGLLEMEQALGRIAASMGFLSAPRSARAVGASPPRSPLDQPVIASFLTPAFSTHNTDELAFALKGGIAAVVCELLVSGLAWPDIQTAIWSSVIVAQSSIGSIVQKGLLRLAGAALGGVLGLAAIVLVMPNGETVIAMILVVGVGASCAAWLATGSSRIAYAGVQAGLAFGLCVVSSAPVTNLTVPRDRVLGILMGILVTGTVFATLGPTLARSGLRDAVAAVLRALAALARVGVAAPDVRATLVPARGLRWNVYQSVARALQLEEEERFEPGGRRPEVVAQRAAVFHATNHALSVMLALLAIVRHRLAIDLTALAGPHARFRALGSAIAATFDRLAEGLEGRPRSNPPDLPALLSEAEAALATEAPRDPVGVVHLRSRLALYGALVDAMKPLVRDVLALAPLPLALPTTREAVAPAHLDGSSP
jgi:multidrug resistance protein MdtO